MTTGASQPPLHSSHPRLGLPLLRQQQLRLGKHDRGRDKLLGCFSVPDEGYGSLKHSQGEKTGARERVTGGRKGFSESSLPSCSRQIGHRGKLRHSRNKLIRDVLEDAWLKRLPVSGSISNFKKLKGPNSLIVNHDSHDSHCGMQHTQWDSNFRFHTKSWKMKQNVTFWNIQNKNNFMMYNEHLSSLPE